jgi:hypothetical protein
MQGLIGQAVGLVLFIERLKTGPTLTEIMEVTGYDRKNEEYVVNWIKKQSA